MLATQGGRSRDRYFRAFAIRIAVEDAVVDTRRTLRQDGWAITYRVDDDSAGGPVLEFYATHRMTNDRHGVIRPTVSSSIKIRSAKC